jgi:hypothetical protein
MRGICGGICGGICDGGNVNRNEKNKWKIK